MNIIFIKSQHRISSNHPRIFCIKYIWPSFNVGLDHHQTGKWGGMILKTNRTDIKIP